MESETGPHELSTEFVFRCPSFQHDGPSPALGFLRFPVLQRELSLRWAPAVLGLSAKLNPSHGTIDVT